MTSFVFTPATKEQAKARIALDGPSGSGKTWTSLVLAKVLSGGGRVAVIDTERGSASKYSDEFTFDALNLTSFEPDTLSRALAAAAAAEYPVVVIDSMSHFGMGIGGMLEQVDNAAKRARGNSFAGWKDAGPMERAMLNAILAYPGHVIVTMRTKTEWVVDEDDRGKKVPRKIGTKPVQRDGIEFEFDVVADMDQDNTLVVSKTRCKAIGGAVVRKPDENFAQIIADWLSSGAPAPDASDYRERALSAEATPATLLELHGEAKGRNLLAAAVQDGKGNPTTLGDLIVTRGRALKASEVTAA
jgi:hypothetical protein